MKTQVKRRYSSLAPEHKEYTDYFDKFLINSTILNDRNQRINVHSNFFDASGLRSMLFELEGDSNGKYTNHWGEELLSLIASAEKKLSYVKTRYEIFLSNQQAQGKKIPATWPPELLSERLKIEASIDVMNREAEWLRHEINQLKEKEAVKRSSKILEYGPRGSGTLKNGVLSEIDGQMTAFIGDVLIINDSTSPYNGMSVADYRDEVVKPWLNERRRSMVEKEQRRAKEILKTGKSDIEVPISSRKIHPSSLPAWPDGVPNHLLVNDQAGEEE